jgi:hypothetical protein
MSSIFFDIILWAKFNRRLINKELQELDLYNELANQLDNLKLAFAGPRTHVGCSIL